MPRFSGTNNSNGYPYNKPAVTKAHVQAISEGLVTGLTNMSTYGGSVLGSTNATTTIIDPFPGEVYVAGNDIPFNDAVAFVTTNTTQSLSITDTNFAIAGDFTIEFWAVTSTVYTPSTPIKISSGVSKYLHIFAVSDNALYNNWSFKAVGVGGLTTSNYTTSVPYLDTGLRGFAVMQNAWKHIAVTREGFTYRMFVNGILYAKKVDTVAPALTSGATTVELNQAYAGKLSNVRIMVGIALYNNDAGFSLSYNNLTTTQTARTGVQESTDATLCKLLMLNGISSIIYDTSSTTQMSESRSQRLFKVATTGVPSSYKLYYNFGSYTSTGFNASDFVDNTLTGQVALTPTTIYKTALLTCASGTAGTSAFTDVSDDPLRNQLTQVYSVSPLSRNTSTIPFANAIAATFSTGTYATTTGNHLILSGDFTIEFWFYPTQLTTATTTSRYIAPLYLTDTAQNIWYIAYSVYVSSTSTVNTWQFSSSVLSGKDAQNFPIVTLNSGIAPTINKWVHVAVNRNGLYYAIYINGVVCAASSSLSLGGLSSTGSILSIAKFEANATYLSNIRITSGGAIYTSGLNFTPQTTPLTAEQNVVVGQETAIISQPSTVTSLLLFTNSSSYLTRMGANAVDGSLYGNQFARIVPVGTTLAPALISVPTLLGGTNGYLYHTNTSYDYVSSYSRGNNDLRNTDFTIECWLYLLVDNVKRGIITTANGTFGTFSFHVNASNYLEFQTIQGGVPLTTFTSTLIVPKYTWTHVAVVIKNTALSFYLNGVSDSGFTVGTFNFSGSESDIGFFIGISSGGADPTRGIISNLRVTRSALYTQATEAVPIKPLTTIDITGGSIADPIKNYSYIYKTAFADKKTEGNETFAFRVASVKATALPVSKTADITILDTSLTPITAIKNAALPTKIIEVIGRASTGWQLFSSVTGGLGRNYGYKGVSFPSGLTVDLLTGILSGAPNGTVSDSTYTATVEQIPDVPYQTADLGSAIFAIRVVTQMSVTVDTAVIPSPTTNILFLVGIAKTIDGIIVSGGTASYSVTGALPAGLSSSVVSVSGVTKIRVSGTATTGDTSSSYTLTITDTATPNQSQSTSFRLFCVPPLSVSGNTYWAALINTSITDTTKYNPWQFTAAGGIPPYTYSANGLPPGWTINSSTGVLSGTAPSTVSNYTIGINVSDTSGQSASIGIFVYIINSTITASGGSLVLYAANPDPWATQPVARTIKDIRTTVVDGFSIDGLLTGTPTGGFGMYAYSPGIYGGSTSVPPTGMTPYVNSQGVNLQEGYTDSRYTTAGFQGTPTVAGQTYLYAVKVTDFGYAGLKVPNTVTVNVGIATVNLVAATETAFAYTIIKVWNGDPITPFRVMTNVTGGYLGGSTTYKWSINGTSGIPGLTIDSTGLISGTPAQRSVSFGSISVTVSDYSSSSKTVYIGLQVENPQVAYITPGTYTWTIPDGVTSVSVVAVGAGGGSGGGYITGTGTTVTGGGGGGGALAYINTASVVPGTTASITVGSGGAAGNGGIGATAATAGGAGENSTFTCGGVTITAGGGKGGGSSTGGGGAAGLGGTIAAGVTGGNGGRGGSGTSNGSNQSAGSGAGGGAGGYSGAGGNGGSGSISSINSIAGTAGAGGGGGGGAGGIYNPTYGGAGGGVGLLGAGANGAGGVKGSYPGKGGSGGTTPGYPGTGESNPGTGGEYGGGGGGYPSRQGSPGGNGAIRIIWATKTVTSRAYPSTNTYNL